MGAQEQQTTETSDPVRSAARAERAYRGPGMALRVAIGFAAVALTVISANLITQRSAKAARDQVRQLLVQHEPLVRATESLAAAVAHYQRTVIDESKRANVPSPEVEQSVQRLLATLSSYEVAAERFPAREFFVPELRAKLESFLDAGDALLLHSASRRDRLRDYWARFEQLEKQLNVPQEQAMRFAGAVFASESVMSLQGALNAIRERVSTAMSVSGAAAAGQSVVATEAAFGALLAQHAKDLETFHGEQWMSAVSSGFAQLVSSRRAAFAAIAAFDEHAALFRDEGASASSMVVTELVEPARRALADADRLALQAYEKADKHLFWASAAALSMLIGIAFATVTSVTRPVQRLTAATRKIASGIVRTRVPRGGSS